MPAQQLHVVGLERFVRLLRWRGDVFVVVEVDHRGL